MFLLSGALTLVALGAFLWGISIEGIEAPQSTPLSLLLGRVAILAVFGAVVCVVFGFIGMYANMLNFQ